MPDLETLGWDGSWAATFEPFGARGLVPGRVAVPHRGAYDVLTEDGPTRARLPGRARRGAASQLPVVGDWVVLERPDGEAAVVREVLPRRTMFSRRAPQDRTADAGEEQVVSANVDVVFVTLPLTEEADARLVERYLALVWESGARPVVVLTKADLTPDPAERVAALRAIAGDGVRVTATSARSGAGLDEVRSQLGRGVTGALVGPSGVGKSTLVNALAGNEHLETAELGPRGGRHTTTRRELVVLPGGAGVLVDNPGMREVHLWLARDGLEDTFPEIDELAAGCRFRDCRHEAEPGCAVRDAVAAGSLPPERLRGYLALRRELKDLEARLLERERSRARPRPGAGGQDPATVTRRSRRPESSSS